MKASIGTSATRALDYKNSDALKFVYSAGAAIIDCDIFLFGARDRQP